MRTLESLGVIGAVCAVGLLAASGPSQAQGAASDMRLRIVSATYGKPRAARVRDFSERLRQTCGPQAVSCESFCSKASIGAGASWLHMPFSARPVCRVIYRCGEGVTRATETDSGDMILLTCKPQA